MPIDLKIQIEEMQGKFHAKTSYEVVEKLIQSHESFGRYQAQVRNEKAAAADRENRELLNVGEKVKTDFEMVKAQLSIKSDADLLTFLLLHYETSQTMDKLTAQFLRNLK